MKFEKFEDIDSWKEARNLISKIYEITKRVEFSKDYALKDQIRRAAISIMANISEGFDSDSKKSFLNFLSYSFRSASEVQSLLYIALDQSYLGNEEFNSLYKQTQKIKGLIGGLRRYLKSNSKTQP